MQPNEDYRAGAATHGSLLTSNNRPIECAEGPFVGFVVKRPFLTYAVKVKDSRNRPGVAQTFPGDLGSKIFMTFGT